MKSFGPKEVNFIWNMEVCESFATHCWTDEVLTKSKMIYQHMNINAVINFFFRIWIKP